MPRSRDAEKFGRPYFYGGLSRHACVPRVKVYCPGRQGKLGKGLCPRGGTEMIVDA